MMSARLKNKNYNNIKTNFELVNYFIIGSINKRRLNSSSQFNRNYLTASILSNNIKKNGKLNCLFGSGDKQRS